MNPWVKLLRLGTAIYYVEEKQKLVVHLDKSDFATASRAVEILSELFDIEPEDVNLKPGGSKSWPLCMEFHCDLNSLDGDEDGKELVYRIEDGVLMLKKYNTWHKLDYEKVKELFEELPEKASPKDALEAADRIGLSLNYTTALMLFEFYDKNVNFDAVAVKDGRRRYLVKQTYSLREENRKKLAVERDVIGTPYEV